MFLEFLNVPRHESPKTRSHVDTFGGYILKQLTVMEIKFVVLLKDFHWVLTGVLEHVSGFLVEGCHIRISLHIEHK